MASSLTGNTIALNGEAYSPNGTGVIGQGGQSGVLGSTSGPGGNGVMGFAAALAVATTRAQIGFAVAQMSLHHPIRMAEQLGADRPPEQGAANRRARPRHRL